MDLYTLINIVYVLSAVTFIVGFKLMSHPATAQRGNLIAAVGIVSAVVVTLMDAHIGRFEYILIGLVAGTLVGLQLARRTSMTGILPAVALLNGFGGLAGFLVAWAEFHAHPAGQGWLGGALLWLAAVSGSVAFSGSMTMWGKMEQKISGKPVGWQRHISRVLVFGVTASGVLFALDTVAPEAYRYFALFAVLALILGAVWAVPFDKSDFSAAVSILNACSGLSACASGFVFQNTLLVATGALVCGGGIALARSILKETNRPAANVLAGGFRDSE